ncbi:1059_t:CDS:2, partial [Ambispora gerdemannii]
TGINIREYNFTVTYRPVKKCGDPSRDVIHINGKHPPPPIEANVGEIIRVNMINHMQKDNITFHFHGIRQRGTPMADGVPFVTQYPTEPNKMYTYEFVACPDQVGTYFYHSHVGLTTITGHGALIIHDKIHPFKYHEERIIVLSDFWNNTDTDEALEAGLYAGPFKFVGPPADLLINGRTAENNECGPDKIIVESNKTYRLRIVGATTLEDLVFGIAGHNMTIIEADGTYVNPVNTEFLEIAPGQRYSVLITTDQIPSDYQITANVLLRTDKVNRVANAILSYKNPKNKTIHTLNLPAQYTLPQLITLDNYDQSIPPLPAKSDRTIVIRSQQVLLRNGGRQWTVNAVSFMDPQSAILLDLYSGNRPVYTDYSKLLANGHNVSIGTYPLRYKETIDLVFQNTFGAEGTCDYHPWHLHGHSFWEIAQGPGEFSFSDTSSFTIQKSSRRRENSIPIYRDTTLIYPSPGTGVPSQGCGWKVVRFIADNPGVWVAHCHIVPHMLMGMMVAFEEATDFLNATSAPPTKKQFCLVH